MIAPQEINWRSYRSVFVFSLKSGIDDSETFGRIVKSNNETRLLQDEMEEETEEKSSGAFNVTVDVHNSTAIGLHLHFENPNSVSQGLNQDIV